VATVGGREPEKNRALRRFKEEQKLLVGRPEAGK